MNLFDELVNEALTNHPEFSLLRMVVEKELLHHDIFRILSNANILSQLSFIGGTCLRACYGSPRLSEDLDFTGGANFTKSDLSGMAKVLIDNLKAKYGLQVEVSEPKREVGNVDTWKLKVQTRLGKKDIPIQRINIDICAIRSYQAQPMMLLNPYGVDMGTSGLILSAESREEIFADKLVAFALRPGRIKARDLWDITWLHQQDVKVPYELIPLKISDHGCEPERFLSLLETHCSSLIKDPSIAVTFREEMRRFLPISLIQTIETTAFWDWLSNLINDLCRQTKKNFFR